MTFDKFPNRVVMEAKKHIECAFPGIKCAKCGVEIQNENGLTPRTFQRRTEELGWQHIKRFERGRFASSRMMMGSRFYKWEHRCPTHNLLKLSVSG